jgi:hypothetical protein
MQIQNLSLIDGQKPLIDFRQIDFALHEIIEIQKVPDRGTGIPYDGGFFFGRCRMFRRQITLTCKGARAHKTRNDKEQESIAALQKAL